MQQQAYADLTLALGASGDQIVLPSDVLAHFSAHRQLRWWQPEAGGQLFASITDHVITVEVATGPRRSDRRFPFTYIPDTKKEAEEIALMYKQGLHYVGDWHTHPERSPRPSWQDIETLQRCFRNSTHDLNAFLLVVVGRAPTPDGLFVAAVDARGLCTLFP